MSTPHKLSHASSHASSHYSEQQPSNYRQHKLSTERYELLDELFSALDQDSTGFLDIKDMQVLGYILTGVMPTVQDTKEQIKRADYDGDDKLSRDEWHAFSLELAKMEPSDFESTFHDLIAKAHVYKENHRRSDDEEDDDDDGE